MILFGCADSSLTPANVAPEPAGALAVSFTRDFPPGFWEAGSHAYRLVLTCPTQNFDPPVVRFTVTPDAPQVETVFLRFDGPGRSPLSPSDLGSVHPDDPTVAVVTLAGMTEADADEARARCHGTVVYDGQDPVPLVPGAYFTP